MRVLLLATAAVLLGCATHTEVDPTRRLEPVATPEPDRPPALLNGTPIRWDELTPAMGEAQGKAALEEVALTRLLRGELARKGLSISEGDVEHERALLLDSLGGGEQGEAALQRVRARRGLGPVRFAALLERNAMLRALVGECTPTDEEVELALRVGYGPRLRVRVILVGTEQEASSIRGRVKRVSGEERVARFAFEAVEHSLDESAARGGRVEAFSIEDPSWPEALRRAAATTDPGEVGPIIVLERGAALVLVEERVPGEPVTPEDRERVEREVRLRKQRERMDALAASLISGADLVAFDESLRWSREHR